MKRLSWILVAALILIPLMCVSVSAEQSHEDHCVCGGAAVGVGDHTQCENMEWKPLSKALAAVGLTMSKANFGKLSSGNYYLDGDVIVTAASSLGTKADALATTPDTTVDINICLNGFDITRSGDGKVFGFLRMGSSLSICDCSYKEGIFGGTVTGGKYNHGSVIYTYSNSTLNIYGGNYVGNAYTSGGAIVIACDLCGDLNGDKVYDDKDKTLATPSVMNLYNGHITGSTVTGSGSAIQLYHTAKLNMYGGTVVGGTAGSANGTVAVSGGCSAAFPGGRVVGGSCKNGKELVQLLYNDGRFIATYTSFANAVKDAENKTDCYLRLINNVTATDTVSGTLYLDLNGFTLDGITITGTLYGMDTTTNGYDGANAGALRPASGKPQLQAKVDGRQYLTIQNETGYSFHRYFAGITKMTLKPSTLGMGYKATFVGSQQVKEALSTATAYGYSIWLDPANKILKGYPAERFGGSQEITLRIDNFLSHNLTPEDNRERGRMPVYACAYLRLADGTMVESEVVSHSFQEMMERADLGFSSYSAAQKAGLTDLSVAFSEAMMGWNISNTHHADGTIWKSVDTAGFKAKLTKRSGDYYNIAGGHYVLSEDIDLGNSKLWVRPGVTVSICLNGHTIKTTNRLFEQYGTLNICDCHVYEKEGGIISSQAGTSNTYASIAYCRYDSVTNVYGGHLQATGKVNSAGMFAISHDGSAYQSHPAAIMNVYGGSFSGGQTYDHGGLLSIWNGGTVNVYNGKFFNGKADKRGGAIDLNKGTLNMYGGEIYNCSAGTNGGAINMMSADATANIINSRIYNNSAAGSGGGIYLSSAALSLGGSTCVTDNTGYNLYNIGGHLSVNELSQGANVGIYTSCTITLGDSTTSISYLFSDNENFDFVQAYGKLLLMSKDMTPATDVSGFNVGFGQMCIDPEEIDGMPLAGYSNPTERHAVDEGRNEYDKIMAQSVAITDENGQTVILIFCDLITASRDFINSVIPSISAATGVPEGHIYINCSHSHSVPSVSTTSVPAVVEYNKTLPDLFAKSALMAMHDRSSATMQTGSFEVQQTVNGKTQFYNFYRHYSYEEDGITKYFGDQFGTAVYDETTKPIRDADHTMHLVRFVRDGKDILMSNWRIHPHFTGGESKYLLSADAIGTIRYYMAQEMPDTHFIYFQGAAGNMNETSRLTSSRVQASQVQNHGLNYVNYGKAVAGIIVDNLDCLENKETGLLKIDHYDYLAKADNPSDEEYAKAKAVYDIFAVETAGMTLGQQNAWVRDYCAANPQYDYVSAFQLSFIVNRRYKQKDTVLPLNVVVLGDSFAFFTAPGEMWDSISMEVEERTNVDTVFCIGYSMDHQHYFVYYPEFEDLPDGVPYVSYESENRHFVAPDTVKDMINYWVETINELSES